MILDLLESRHHQNTKIIYDKNKNTMENDNSGDTGDNSNNSDNTDLVGGFNPSEKYEGQLGWWNSQYMEK